MTIEQIDEVEAGTRRIHELSMLLQLLADSSEVQPEMKHALWGLHYVADRAVDQISAATGGPRP